MINLTLEEVLLVGVLVLLLRVLCVSPPVGAWGAGCSLVRDISTSEDGGKFADARKKDD